MNLKEFTNLLSWFFAWFWLVWFWLAITIVLIAFNMYAVYLTRKNKHFCSGVPGLPPVIGTLPVAGAIMHLLQLPLWTLQAVSPLVFIVILACRLYYSN